MTTSGTEKVIITPGLTRVSIFIYCFFLTEVVCHILIKKRKIRAQQHTLLDQRRSQLHPSVGGQAGKFYKCQMFELIEIPEESSFTPLPTPYVSLELFIFGAKYLPQIILYR